MYLAKLLAAPPVALGEFRALPDEPRYELDRDYVRKQRLLAHFPSNPSAVEATSPSNSAHLNDIAGALGRPGLFARLFDQGAGPPDWSRSSSPHAITSIDSS